MDILQCVSIDETSYAMLFGLYMNKRNMNVFYHQVHIQHSDQHFHSENIQFLKNLNFPSLTEILEEKSSNNIHDTHFYKNSNAQKQNAI